MAWSAFKGGVPLFVRPEDETTQILGVDLTVRPQGPHRDVVLPLPIPPEQADRVEWLPAPDHALFRHLDALFHPLVHASDEVTVAKNLAPPRMPPRARVEGGIIVGRDGLVQVGLTGHTGQVAPDAVCVWARITPPPLPVFVRWLGMNWGWPKASLAIRMPRPSPQRLIFPTRGLAHWPQAFNPGPTLYVQTPRAPGPVWVDPEHAPGHPFDWRRQDRSGERPAPIHPEWPIFRAFSTARAAAQDVVLDILDRGFRPPASPL
ncbi:MAG: hypothetical protein AAFV29_06235 [Myxococcota bacterium]